MTEGAIKTTSNGSFDGFLLALNTLDLSFNTNPVLSIADTEFTEIIKYYPNLTNGAVQFYFHNTITYKYTLTNYLGQQLKSGTLNSVDKSISLTEFPKGIYFVNLADKKRITTIKIIKD